MGKSSSAPTAAAIQQQAIALARVRQPFGTPAVGMLSAFKTVRRARRTAFKLVATLHPIHAFPWHPRAGITQAIKLGTTQMERRYQQQQIQTARTAIAPAIQITATRKMQSAM